MKTRMIKRKGTLLSSVAVLSIATEDSSVPFRLMILVFMVPP